MERNKLVTEGSGAAPLAALLAGKVNGLSGKNVVALVSGGNVDIATVVKIIERELVLQHRRIRFSVELADKVGKLGTLISDISSLGGNVVTARQDSNWNEKGLDYANVNFEVTAESPEHGKHIIEQLTSKGYLVTTK